MGWFKMNKRLRVFEAFAGIGAQVSALKKSGIDYEIVGISEWFIAALNCYRAIHFADVDVLEYESKDIAEMREFLSKFSFSKDSVVGITNLSKLSDKEIKELYITNSIVKNKGSIVDINAGDVGECDLFIYSFPCQDLSTGGKTKGMSEGSGTRSSLLWEVKRILLGLKDTNKLPQYLLMENVRTIFAESNRQDFDQWLNFLVGLGYKNSDQLILDSYNFGVPQSRKRAFLISALNRKIDVSSLKERHTRYKDISEFIDYKYNQKDYFQIERRLEANEAQLNKTISREKMWEINQRTKINNELKIHTITCNMDRSNTAAMFKYNGPKGDTFRLLTIREAFLCMGFTPDEYEKTKSLGYSYRKMNKLIGNSIVVDVLSEIFTLIYDNFTGEGK